MNAKLSTALMIAAMTPSVRPQTRPEKIAAPAATSTMPRMRCTQPQAVKSTLTTRPFERTR